MVKDSENGGTERERRGDRAYHGGQCRLEARGGRGGVRAVCVQFACTVAIAVLMNINKQAKEGGEDGEE